MACLKRLLWLNPQLGNLNRLVFKLSFTDIACLLSGKVGSHGPDRLANADIRSNELFR